MLFAFEVVELILNAVSSGFSMSKVRTIWRFQSFRFCVEYRFQTPHFLVLHSFILFFQMFSLFSLSVFSKKQQNVAEQNIYVIRRPRVLHLKFCNDT
jgi:hypothetical protein